MIVYKYRGKLYESDSLPEDLIEKPTFYCFNFSSVGNLDFELTAYQGA